MSLYIRTKNRIKRGMPIYYLIPYRYENYNQINKYLVNNSNFNYNGIYSEKFHKRSLFIQLLFISLIIADW